MASPNAADAHLLTGAYALDALDAPEEVRAVEAHLALCEECRDEVRSLRETAGVLAAAVTATPPESLRSHVLAEIRSTPQSPPPSHGTAARADGATDGVTAEQEAWRRRVEARRRPVTQRVLAAAAAVALFGGAVGGGVYGWQQRQDARQAEQSAAQLASIIGDPSSRKVTRGLATGGTATLVVRGSEGVVLATGVPGLPAGKVYQVWRVRGENDISSAGLGPGGSNAAGSWDRSVTGLEPGDAVALSVEPTGGSRQPTTTPLVLLQA